MFWRDRFPFLIHADEQGQLTPGPHFGWSPERRAEGFNKTQHQMYAFRLRNEISTAIEAGVVRQAAAALISFRNRFNELRDDLNRSIDKLKGGSNASLLALFGSETAPARSEVKLALRTAGESLKA